MPITQASSCHSRIGLGIAIIPIRTIVTLSCHTSVCLKYECLRPSNSEIVDAYFHIHGKEPVEDDAESERAV